MKKKKQLLLYLSFDFLTAMLAWFSFVNFRVHFVSTEVVVNGLFFEANVRFLSALFGLPVIWVMLYAVSGSYRELFRKSRLKEFGHTFILSIIGNIVIFFVLILDDRVGDYKNYYTLFWVLTGFHFGLTWTARFIITHTTKRRVARGKAGFNTLLVGGSSKAFDLYFSLKANDDGYGYRFVGYVDKNSRQVSPPGKDLARLGSISDIEKVVKKYEVEEVIIALESSRDNEIEFLLAKLEPLDLIIKTIPSLYDALTGKVNLSFFLGTPLMRVSHNSMPAWQATVKRVFDFGFSAAAIIFLSPLFLFAAAGIKISSPSGGVFYKQERIGRKGIPFYIYKFRTMIPDAEKNGPQLSSDKDPRVTPFGRFLRKYRIDEIPQFINVVKGEMSVVGPRPERQFYIDKIMEHAPHYTKILQVRPGITSWGAVKYGYTENVEQMLEQLRYDIFYVENMSLYLDFKILLYTIGVVLKREGK